MDANMLLRYRKYMISIEMILLCLIGIVSSIQASIIDVPATAASLRGRTLYTLYTDKRTWKEAREVCRQNGGYLINIETEEKYQRYIAMKAGIFAPDIGEPWTGLYWTTSSSIHWDGPGCPPPQANLSESYHWKNVDQCRHHPNKLCYRDDDGLETHKCDKDNTFICESYLNDMCSYTETAITGFTFRDHGNGSTPTLNDCKTSCDNTSGCFLTGSQFQVCLMLLATDVSNTTIAIKNCSYETTIETSEQNVAEDGSDPTDCAVASVIPVSSTIMCPTETATVTESSTEATTFTEIFNNTVTEYSTNWSTTTEFVTDVSTFTVTTTEAVTVEFPLVSIVTQQVGNIVSTALQISTVTIAASSLLVSTVTETQTHSFDTVTVDVTGSRSSTFLYSSSPCPSETVQSVDTTIQPSFSSIQINDTSASSSTSIKGVVGSDGIMRTMVCRKVIVVTPDPIAEQAAVESIVNELTVDKKNITAVVQKKVSAQDKRSSSIAIGYIGIAFLVIPFLIIIAVDLPRCIQGGSDVIKLCKDQDVF